MQPAEDLSELFAASPDSHKLMVDLWRAVLDATSQVRETVQRTEHVTRSAEEVRRELFVTVRQHLDRVHAPHPVNLEVRIAATSSLVHLKVRVTTLDHERDPLPMVHMLTLNRKEGWDA